MVRGYVLCCWLGSDTRFKNADLETIIHINIEHQSTYCPVFASRDSIMHVKAKSSNLKGNFILLIYTAKRHMTFIQRHLDRAVNMVLAISLGSKQLQ